MSTRQAILDQALVLFAQKGFDGTTVQDLATLVGIKAASLYSHFPGKEAIFRAVLDHALADWQERVDGLFAAGEPGEDLRSGLERILTGFARGIAGSVEYRFWTRLYVFPPPFLGEEELARLVATDQEFVERLGAYCAPKTAASPDLREVFCSSLVSFVMGVMMNPLVFAGDALDRELARGIAFHLKALEAP